MLTYSIIQKSQLEGALRLDAEYYQPEYVETKNAILKMPNKRLGQLIEVLTDYHANGSYEVLRKNVSISSDRDYALMVRAVDFGKNDFENDVRYVSEKAYRFLRKTQMFGDELLIDKIGKVGDVFLMPKLNKPVTLGMNLFMLRLKTIVNPAYVYLFLLSKYGRALILQKVTGTAPLSIDKNSVRDILIPIPSLIIQRECQSLLQESFEEDEISKDLYQQAENLLLEKLGLKNWKLEESLNCVVNLSEVEEAGRLDAEYFITEFSSAVSKIPIKFLRKLGEIVTFEKGFETGSEAYQEEGKLFIRVSSISKDGIIDKDQKYLSDEIYQKLEKDYRPSVGEILLTKDASPGVAVLIKEQIEGIISGGILRLKTREDLDGDYLELCLNSVVVQEQVKRDSGGSVIAHWKPEQIKNTLIPILPVKTREKIAELVRKSHEARKKSKELLEEAKRKVEEMIDSASSLQVKKGAN